MGLAMLRGVTPSRRLVVGSDPDGHVFGHSRGVLQWPEVAEVGPHNEGALWKSLGSSRSEGSRANVILTPGHNGHRAGFCVR